jgi:uncharacterized protein YbaP (TraB family)
MFSGGIIARSSLTLAFFIAALAAQAEPAMWVIKKKQTTVYLFGTIHILRPETVWNVPKIKKAAARSSELWLEVPMDAQELSMVEPMHKYGFDPTKPLAEKLTPEQHARLEKVAAEYTFPINLLDQMRPWYAGMTLGMMRMMKAGYTSNAGVEMVLQTDARIRRHKVAGLETLEQQLKILAEIPEADAIDLLMQSIDDAEKGVALLQEMDEAWNNADLRSIERIFVDEMKTQAPAAYQHLLVERNQRWSEQIARMLKTPGVKFVAVGTAHLVGPDSVQAQLAKRGIKVSRY